LRVARPQGHRAPTSRSSTPRHHHPLPRNDNFSSALSSGRWLVGAQAHGSDRDHSRPTARVDGSARRSALDAFPARPEPLPRSALEAVVAARPSSRRGIPRLRVGCGRSGCRSSFAPSGWRRSSPARRGGPRHGLQVYWSVARHPLRGPTHVINGFTDPRCGGLGR